MLGKILIVEDGQEMQMLIHAALKGVGELTFVSTIAEAGSAVKAQQFELCLLDVSLPDGDGFSFCANLRNEFSSGKLPLFFLSGKINVADKVQAFQLGADDYITKPFEPQELKARVAAKLRTSRERSDDTGLGVGNLRIVVATQQVFLRAQDGRELRIDLSPLEFRILHYFVRHENHVLSRTQLLEGVWGPNLHVFDRTVDTHVSHLRKKIAGASHEIEAIKGAGYSLRAVV